MRKSFYNAIIILVGVIVLAGGGFAQGKHGGGGGNKHGGGDHSNGDGNVQRDGGGRAKFEDRGGDRGNRGGNGNGWGRQRGGDDQRVFQQQQRQQIDWARQQQRQNEQNARQAQRQNEWNIRQQQQAWRQQIEASRRQYQPQPVDRHDRGRHNGWNADGPRGNAYGLRGVWPGEFRGWRDGDKWDRKQAKRLRNSTAYNYSDPIVSFYPAYRQQNYYYNRPSSRENIVRSIISSFFAPQQSRYSDDYYAPVYRSYTPVYYQQPQYYATPNYSYATYSPGYASGYYGQDYYDPYGPSPLFGTQLYGGGLKSSLLNIGLSLLQGFLGQGYQQGLYQGEYVRDYYGRPVNTYYGPYAVTEPVYYSPIVSSFADQRQLFEEGYRLGYRDAMLDRDPYGTGYGVGNVDLVSAYLANSCMNSI